MLARALATVSLAAMLVSCVSVVKVKDKDDKNVPGIPFYVKSEFFRQETVYRETWSRLTLTVDKKLRDDKKGKEELVPRGSESFVREVLDPNSSQVTALKTAILKGDTNDVDVAIDLVAQFRNLPQRGTTANSQPLKNSIVSEWRVDSSKTYYLNAPLPWFGTASLTQELNADGTLSKVTSTADTKLAEAVASWIPLKEYLTGEFVEPATEAVKDDDKKGMVGMTARRGAFADEPPRLEDKDLVFIVSLKTEEVGFETTVTGNPLDKRPDKTPTALLLTATDVAISRKSLEETTEEKKDDAPTIGISGSIKLPKPETPKEGG